MASSSAVGSAAANRALFAADLFGSIAEGHTKENVVISPISIQTCLAVAYMGANGQTEQELCQVLRFDTSKKTEIADEFNQLLNKKSFDWHKCSFRKSSPMSTSMKIANKIYANQNLKMQPKFVKMAKKFFNSEAENLDFAQSTESLNKINKWVEDNTNNKIRNLLQPGAIDGDTAAILVNAIHFKAMWKDKFSEDSTKPIDFWTSTTESVQVPTMVKTSKMPFDNGFKYGVFADLEATALEMPYEGDDEMSMLLVLPNKRDGLAALEQKLKTVDVLALPEEMMLENVDIALPKFKAELTVELKDVLKNLGITSLFSDSANLSGMFKSEDAIKVSDVFHKAFIDVNEAGSEAAAATIKKYYFCSLNSNQKYFQADHPFVWVIKDKNSVYFMGHVAKL